MPGRSHRGPLAPLTPQEIAVRDRLRRSVEHLAGKIGERTVFRSEKLSEAAAWIEAELEATGLDVRSDVFKVQGTDCRNLWAEIRGRSRPDEIVLAGAHYDSGPNCPGANDNASAVAALLEIARILTTAQPGRTVRLAAFVNEEPPWFQTEDMGSMVHARASRARGDKIVSMISLETIGYYRDEPGTQAYPPPLRFIYPDTGNFIGFVGNFSSRKLVREAIRIFRESASFPSEGGAPPGWIPGVDWSDHWSFWQIGVPAIMVTDTAPFRYPFYHTPEDTPDKVDYDRLARVTAGLARTIEGLSRP
jgi:Zn-dependent M28 family amino/carboxypeptidase